MLVPRRDDGGLEVSCLEGRDQLLVLLVAYRLPFQRVDHVDGAVIKPVPYIEPKRLEEVLVREAHVKQVKGFVQRVGFTEISVGRKLPDLLVDLSQRLALLRRDLPYHALQRVRFDHADRVVIVFYVLQGECPQGDPPARNDRDETRPFQLEEGIPEGGDADPEFPAEFATQIGRASCRERV